MESSSIGDSIQLLNGDNKYECIGSNDWEVIMQHLSEIYAVKESAIAGKISIEQGRKQIVKLIEGSGFFPAIKSTHSYIITMISTSLYAHELEDSVEKYFTYIDKFCAKTRNQIERESMFYSASKACLVD